jgi:adenylate cyclase
MPSPDLISLPAFLRTPDEAKQWVETPCVARERELAQLDTYLNAAVAGDGGIAFITGDAGNGKTRLAQEFARQAQDRHPHLVVATGNCNAHTGIGDPYLPFREILALLTGDIETRWAAGGMSRTAAQRLWGTVPHVVKALVDVGPDLVDIFVSGPPLVTRATAAAPGESGALAQLKTLVARHQTAPAPAHLRQRDLFAQYTRVLHMLARQGPLLLILDDLQWADAGSISLLFHLGRQLESQRILVVGLYRPADIALGRAGDRHPLEPVVNELQRHFRNTQVELRQSGEGKQLVEAFLDTEPNRLGIGFREALYRQTGGHPLFTVEMFHGLQARGDLIQDEGGHWIEGPVLDWQTLPARVEGVINERISRLPLTLQEVLKVASVEGEVFTAEVVARVQAIEERHMISQLSHVLDRQQRLVAVEVSQQLETKRLSRYRFRHILFQKFIYDSLDQVERIYLHRAVGNELEQLHAERVDTVASQLARHFAACGDDRHALRYFTLAGDAAARVYANAEAVEHYTRALELARRDETSSDELVQLYTSLGRALELNSQFDRVLANYEDMENLAHKRGDRPLRLVSLTARVTLYATFTPIYDPVRAQTLAEQALALAHDLDDKTAEAKILWNLLLVYRAANKLSKAIECGERSLALARTLGLREQMAFTLNDLGSQCYFINGSFNQARLALQEANGLWRELNNLPMLANSLASSCAVCFYMGEYDQALTLSEEAFEINQSINNLWGQSHSRYKLG